VLVLLVIVSSSIACRTGALVAGLNLRVVLAMRREADAKLEALRTLAMRV
jgi:hypothetical protein